MSPPSPHDIPYLSFEGWPWGAVDICSKVDALPAPVPLHFLEAEIGGPWAMSIFGAGADKTQQFGSDF